MKRTLFFLVAISILTATSCTNYEDGNNNSVEQKDFYSNLEKYRMKQYNIFNRMSTRSDCVISEQELQDIAAETDKNITDFYNENKEIIDPFVPEVSITEDELALMEHDDDALLAFVKENYSENVYESVETVLYDEDVDFESLMHNEVLNPYELAVIANVDIAAQYEDVVKLASNTSNKEDSNECLMELRRKILSIALLVRGRNPLAGLVVPYKILVATNEYQVCVANKHKDTSIRQN